MVVVRLEIRKYFTRSGIDGGDGSVPERAKNITGTVTLDRTNARVRFF
jgi:hypothetical protein|tara:strand:- start:201 stop:344 length:144 start_codon:yes stop_codon:yes gene_type:complete